MLVKFDAAHTLRERLSENLGSKGKLPTHYILALCIKAWNHFRKNRPVKCLKYTDKGDTPEEFPVAL